MKQANIKPLYDTWQKNRDAESFRSWILAVKAKRDAGNKLNPIEGSYLWTYESSTPEEQRMNLYGKL